MSNQNPQPSTLETIAALTTHGLALLILLFALVHML